MQRAVVWEGMVGASGFLLGLLTLGMSTIIDWAAWYLVLPGRKPGALGAALEFRADPVAPEKRLGEPIEAVAADGVVLAGLWHAADAWRGAGEYAPPGASGSGDGPRGTVLVLHGFAEDPAALRERMVALNRHGWNVAALDNRASGRSGGDFGSFGTREAGDVIAWLAALDRDPGRLGTVALWGRSMGAGVAIRAAAAAAGPRVAALVLEAPYLTLVDAVAVVFKRRRVPLGRFWARLVVRRAGKFAGVPLGWPPPAEVANRLDLPVLIVHGTADTLVPLVAAKRLASAFPEPARLVEVEGAGHNTIIETGGTPLLDLIAGFLDTSCGGSKPRSRKLGGSGRLDGTGAPADNP